MKAVNLLPPDTRGAARAPAEHSVVVDDSSGIGVFAILGGLAVAVVAFAGFVLAGNAIKDREAQLATVSAQQQQVAASAAALKPYAEFEQLASERVATIRDLAGRRFDWEQALRDLSRALPADVTLSEISGNVSTDAGGGGGSSLRTAISAPAMTLTGCTPNQRSVARLMSRLRNVDGVTRVSLARSEKVAAAETASGSAGVPMTEESVMAARMTAPCGVGMRPQFEIVIFFEGQAEAATAPSATPPAAGEAGAPGQPAEATPTPTPAAGAAAAATPAATTTSTDPQATPTPQAGVTP